MAAAWAAVAVSALALAWVVSTWLLTRALRHAATNAVTEEQLRRLQADLDRLAAAEDRQVQLLAEQMRDDRNATNTRLRWLEEHLWTSSMRAS